mgnify:CR=1 FL=1
MSEKVQGSLRSLFEELHLGSSLHYAIRNETGKTMFLTASNNQTYIVFAYPFGFFPQKILATFPNFCIFKYFFTPSI